jgi:hypothetical protein
MYWKLAIVDGEVVSVHQPSHEGTSTGSTVSMTRRH